MLLIFRNIQMKTFRAGARIEIFKNHVMLPVRSESRVENGLSPVVQPGLDSFGPRVVHRPWKLQIDLQIPARFGHVRFRQRQRHGKRAGRLAVRFDPAAGVMVLFLVLKVSELWFNFPNPMPTPNPLPPWLICLRHRLRQLRRVKSYGASRRGIEGNGLVSWLRRETRFPEAPPRL